MTEGALELRLESRAERFDEDQLLVADAQKDVEAAAGLDDKYYAEVFRYVYHSTLDHAVAEDLTANVFLSAFRHLGRFEWRRIPFRAWLYRIATNEIRMHYRRRRWASFTRLEPENGELPSEAPSAPECLAARGTTLKGAAKTASISLAPGRKRFTKRPIGMLMETPRPSRLPR